MTVSAVIPRQRVGAVEEAKTAGTSVAVVVLGAARKVAALPSLWETPRNLEASSW